MSKRNKEKIIRKLSDNEFLSALRKCSGIYSRTARYIEKVYEVSYSRQAVRDRAEKHPEEYADILEQNIDVAEEGLMALMKSKTEAVRLRASEMYLKTIGKKRGYVERNEFTGKDGKDISISIVDPFQKIRENSDIKSEEK